MVRIALIGAQGRLGSSIAEEAKSDGAKDAVIAVAIGRSNPEDLMKRFESFEVIVDVSSPQAGETFLRQLMDRGAKTPYIVGSTGWSDDQFKIIEEYARGACVVWAPNFSPVVNLFLGLIEQAAPLLAQWGYESEVYEVHHNRKKDAPSGTAKAIIERMKPLKPQVHATRAGNIIGTHKVSFFGPSDVLSLRHEALDRVIFARGALLAAAWAKQQKTPGLFSMKNVVFGS